LIIILTRLSKGFNWHTATFDSFCLDSGSKKVDKSLGKSLQGIQLGTRAATAVFMYSFSGGHENGAMMRPLDSDRTSSQVKNGIRSKGD